MRLSSLSFVLSPRTLLLSPLFYRLIARNSPASSGFMRQLLEYEKLNMGVTSLPLHFFEDDWGYHKLWNTPPSHSWTNCGRYPLTVFPRHHSFIANVLMLLPSMKTWVCFISPFRALWSRFWRHAEYFCCLMSARSLLSDCLLPSWLPNWFSVVLSICSCWTASFILSLWMRHDFLPSYHDLKGLDLAVYQYFALLSLHQVRKLKLEQFCH